MRCATRWERLRQPMSHRAHQGCAEVAIVHRLGLLVPEHPGYEKNCRAHNTRGVTHAAQVCGQAEVASPAPRPPDLRPPAFLPVSQRTSSRPLHSFATGRPFSYPAKAPATWPSSCGRDRTVGQIRRRCCQQSNTAIRQERDTQFLHNHRAGEPTGAFDDDCANVIAFDLVEQGRKARHAAPCCK
jgi:hypothetical protein